MAMFGLCDVKNSAFVQLHMEPVWFAFMHYIYLENFKYGRMQGIEAKCFTRNFSRKIFDHPLKLGIINPVLLVR